MLKHALLVDAVKRCWLMLNTLLVDVKHAVGWCLNALLVDAGWCCAVGW